MFVRAMVTSLMLALGTATGFLLAANASPATETPFEVLGAGRESQGLDARLSAG